MRTSGAEKIAVYDLGGGTSTSRSWSLTRASIPLVFFRTQLVD